MEGAELPSEIATGVRSFLSFFLWVIGLLRWCRVCQESHVKHCLCTEPKWPLFLCATEWLNLSNSSMQIGVLHLCHSANHFSMLKLVCMSESWPRNMCKGATLDNWWEWLFVSDGQWHAFSHDHKMHIFSVFVSCWHHSLQRQKLNKILTKWKQETTMNSQLLSFLWISSCKFDFLNAFSVSGPCDIWTNNQLTNQLCENPWSKLLAHFAWLCKIKSDVLPLKCFWQQCQISGFSALQSPQQHASDAFALMCHAPCVTEMHAREQTDNIRNPWQTSHQSLGWCTMPLPAQEGGKMMVLHLSGHHPCCLGKLLWMGNQHSSVHPYCPCWYAFVRQSHCRW